MTIKLLLVFVGLMFGNFVAESFHAVPDFSTPLERSFFQGWALLTFWVLEIFCWDGEI
jgi:hypothetical protein